MKATLKEVLEWAESRKCAVGAFNTPTFENIVAVIGAAEKAGVPVIISHAELHEPVAPIDRIGPLMIWAAERAKVAPRVKELKKKVEHCEKKIETLQAELDVASAELFNPTPTTNFAEVNRKVRTLQFEIDRYTEDWEKAATELEELQS